MKKMILVLVAVFGMSSVALASSVQAKELKKSRDLFDFLRAISGQTGEAKPPTSVTLNNLKCSQGQTQIKCRAQNAETKKDIVLNGSDSADLFSFLKKKNAPSFVQPGFGAATHHFEAVSCTYQNQNYPYYSCEAKGTVNLN